MKKIVYFILPLLLISCANNYKEVQIEDNDKIAVCGEVAGEKQTYPTLKDLKDDGARFLFYGPCYGK